MSLLEFIQLIIRNRKWIFYLPMLIGSVVLVMTRDLPHTYSSSTVIYTGIASGFNPDNGFENKLDFHAANSRFDNLINIIGSKETRKDIGIHLLSFMLHNDAARNSMVINSKNKRLKNILSDNFISKYRKSSIQATQDSLDIILNEGTDNDIYQLIYGNTTTPFSINTLEGLHASRLASSDMLKIEFNSEDPLTCKNTLDFTTDIFLLKYQNVRIGEADVALKYFTEQTNEAKNILQINEEKLKNFRSKNGVINYYEQTKYVADQKDDIEKNATRLRMDLEGYRSALIKVEQKLGSRALLQLQNEKILNTRNELSQEFQRKGIETVKSGIQSSDNNTIQNLKNELKNTVENLYNLNNTIEGLPTRDLLEQWIQLTLNVDETQSKLGVLINYQKEFEKVFDRFAPLGSDLNKLERDVDVSEKEYLDLLHNLSQAILRKNNLQASENISVVDPADLPLTSNPSKRLLLVIMSVLSTSIFSIVLMILKQFLDNSISSPINLDKTTGISSITAFSKRNLPADILNIMDERSLSRWSNTLEDAKQKCEPGSSIYIIPFNCTLINSEGYLDLLLKSEKEFDTSKKSDKDTSTSEISGNNNFLTISDKKTPEQFTVKFLSKVCTIILILDAAKKLDEYELQTIEKWKLSRIPVKAILINTCEIEMSKFLGEIPKKRSRFRSFIKRQIIRYAA